MGQKVHPVGFRTGVMIGWKSRWYAPKEEFSTLLLEDKKIRDFVKLHPTKNYKAAGIDRIEIERTRDEVKIALYVARPGLIIGKKGQDVDVLQTELQNLIGRRVNLKIEEVARPDLQAQLVAEKVAEQLAKRGNFRKTMKRAMEEAMDAGAKGIKIQLAGRLGGAEMARREKQSSGSIPLSTLRAKIDYGFTEAVTAQGHIGVQVWINQGTYDGEVVDGPDAQTGQTPKGPKRSYKR
jgi:small subunit ribosomal protein S3